MKLLKRTIASILAVAALVAQPASAAYDWSVTAHVTYVEPTNMPSVLYFKVDAAGGNCAAGQTLSWAIRGADATAQAANANAVYSALLTALVSNRTVEIYGLNADCSINYIHVR